MHQTAQKRIITYITSRFSSCADFIKRAEAAGHYPQGDNPALGHASVPKQLKKQRAKSRGLFAFASDHFQSIIDPEKLSS